MPQLTELYHKCEIVHDFVSKFAERILEDSTL